MREFSIDLDILKHILRCRSVRNLRWRLSSSGKGFHFTWQCTKVRCAHCAAIEKEFDDPARFKHDRKRRSYRARILWDIKGGKVAGQWNKIK